MSSIRIRKAKIMKEDFVAEKIEAKKEIASDSNLLLLTCNKFNQNTDKINSKLRVALKQIKQFFENLPLSDEVNIDEESTNPIEHYLGDRSNYRLPLELEHRPISVSLTNMLPFQIKDSIQKEKKSDRKRKCEESQISQNLKQVRITSQ